MCECACECAYLLFSCLTCGQFCFPHLHAFLAIILGCYELQPCTLMLRHFRFCSIYLCLCFFSLVCVRFKGLNLHTGKHKIMQIMITKQNGRTCNFNRSMSSLHFRISAEAAFTFPIAVLWFLVAISFSFSSFAAAALSLFFRNSTLRVD